MSPTTLIVYIHMFNIHFTSPPQLFVYVTHPSHPLPLAIVPPILLSFFFRRNERKVDRAPAEKNGGLAQAGGDDSPGQFNPDLISTNCYL